MKPNKRLKITEGLNEEDYPAVQAKVSALIASGSATLQTLAKWCEAQGECACSGCANRHLSWSEWECWRKYSRQVNAQAKVTA